MIRPFAPRELPDPPIRDLQALPEMQDGPYDPTVWSCSVCGKVRARDLLHSKAILGRQVLVCAPSCLGAQRRAGGR